MPKRKPNKKNKGKPFGEKAKKILINFFVFCSLSAVLAVSVVFFYYIKDFPRPEVFTERQLAQTTNIYDRTGEVLLYEIYGEERRTWISLDAVPEHLKQAVIAVEDANFYNHYGIDFKGIARSILIDIQLGKPVSGGSTICQQLIRSTFLTNKKTAERKIREIILSIELDRRYSKDKILEWYLNQVPFGQNAYGIEAASQTYFKKSVSEISVSEAAILAALIQAPYRLSPYGENKDMLLERKNYVLDRMASENFLTIKESEEKKKEEIIFIKPQTEIKAPYFTLWVKQELENKYGREFLRKSGWDIYTSIDWEIQKIAEEAMKNGVENNKNHNAHNAGLVAINPKNGEVLAMVVGNGDYYSPSFPEGCISGVDCLFDPKFNVVVGTKGSTGRQPGSAFKPFVYATAFKQGYSDQDTVFDEETNFGIWGDKEYIPQNYDGLFRGNVTLRNSLSQSLNIPSVKVLLDLAGIQNSIETAKDLGINTLRPPYGPSIVLGGWEVKLIDITSAYGVFANDGMRVSPVSILKIEDSNKNIIEENKKTPKSVLDSESARIINSILSDNEARSPMFGLYSALYFKGYQVAAKTGTTQDYRDAWTIGYTPSIVCGVWVGNNNNASMAEEPGVVLAGPIFHNFIENTFSFFQKEDFNSPKEREAIITTTTSTNSTPSPLN